MNILNKLEEYSSSQVDRVSFVSRDGELTYGELWQKSGRLAAWIDERMGDDKDPVVVYGHKDPLMLVCFIACVRSGRAYCPVDISTPEERIIQITETIGGPLVLIAASDYLRDSQSERTMAEAFGPDSRVINREDIESITDKVIEDIADKAAGEAGLKPCAGEDNFYIIFTSGTTGRPKGVQITANNLNNYVDWAVTLADGIESRSIFLNQAPYSFDLSVMDLYLSLATGGTIVSVDSELQKDAGRLMEYLSDYRINYWVSTPSFADMCLANAQFGETVLPGIQAFLFCGEVLANETALSLIRRFPDAKVINTYGPTESTVCISEVRITEEMAAGDDPLPVGRVRRGTEVRLDPDSSEIIIIGDTVSPGYFREPGLTSRSFMTRSQFDDMGIGESRVTSDTGCIRAYRTGDKGRFGEDGMLYCDGRIDNQIKLHGYRIEIEDIEANLAKVSGIRRSAVAPRKSGGKVESLTAFVVCDSTIPNDYSGRKAIRTELRELMPSYMVPKRIVFLDSLPMTNNGKLDRKKLGGMA